MFSKACEYGIRAVIYIVSVSSSGKKAGIKDICKHIKAPEPFTAKILQNLSRLGIVKSTKGPHGGFYVEEGAHDIRLIDIVTAIDGDKLFTGCGLGVDVCSEKKPCPIHNEFKSIRESLRIMLEKTSIQHIAKDLDKGLVFLKT
ncbi:transcriptional regulator, BadM/Rrf2 family [Fulvivirga imtechensis AK7]|uniref:Transcriptional regulator, BadM/Rrf2 family n=1 Tax=Fulvivirga imtechensis AK7 TaxID=1237149 RepID=L8JSS5_9BACT|nr:Rrf2 family transcriptional regulator [Fulvivirga imtechensis]ELR70549.1 transcriptional regulator, BadM/Rrf2 family [Fulvivirga imtechensis AK7]